MDPLTRPWRDYSLTVIIVIHIKEAFAPGTRVPAWKASRSTVLHRSGATVYDLSPAARVEAIVC